MNIVQFLINFFWNALKSGITTAKQVIALITYNHINTGLNRMYTKIVF